MAYMEADTGNKVGFRPYGSTNPQCAATLSGLGQNHPFKPEAWALHPALGMGDYEFNRPFDPWELYEHHPGMLHGLAGLGDTSEITQQAADDLFLDDTITSEQHDAIVAGTMTFNDALGFDPTDQTSWVNAVGMLQKWNSDLQSIEAQVSAANLQNLQSGTQPSAAFTALSQSVQQQRTQYENLAQQFINAYRTVTGNVPSGLTGLGILPIVAWAIGVGAVLVAVYFGYQAFQNWKASINVQQTIASTAAQQQATTTASSQTLLQQLAVAQAKGDTATAQAILQTLAKIGTPPPGGAPMSALEKWLTDNMLYIGIGAAGLLVLPNLFGGRRR